MLKKHSNEEERLCAEQDLMEISKYVDPSSLVILDDTTTASGGDKDIDAVMVAVDMVYAPWPNKRKATEYTPHVAKRGRAVIVVPLVNKKKTTLDHTADQKQLHRQIMRERNKKK